MGRQRGILRLFFLPLGARCPMCDTWSLARKPVPLGMGVGHTVNKEHKQVPLTRPAHQHTHPQGGRMAGVQKQWEPVSHGGSRDNASSKQLPLALCRGACVGS